MNDLKDANEKLTAVISALEQQLATKDELADFQNKLMERQEGIIENLRSKVARYEAGICGSAQVSKTCDAGSTPAPHANRTVEDYAMSLWMQAHTLNLQRGMGARDAALDADLAVSAFKEKFHAAE